MSRHITEECSNMIKKYEGLRLKSYRCQAGILTIGYGHTQGVTNGMKITKEEADDYFKQDIEKFEQYTESLTMRYGYKLNDNQFSALTSFFYNLGKIGFQLTNNGTRNLETIGNKMLEYCKCRKGNVLTVSKGLSKRRHEERALFFKDWVDPSETSEKNKPTIRKALHFSRKYSQGYKIRLSKVTCLCSDNAITPIEYLENETVTFYGLYNKDIVTQYLLVQTSRGKTGYIKNLYLDL